jgi:hypothetical protein
VSVALGQQIAFVGPGFDPVQMCSLTRRGELVLELLRGWL